MECVVQNGSKAAFGIEKIRRASCHIDSYLDGSYVKIEIKRRQILFDMRGHSIADNASRQVTHINNRNLQGNVSLLFPVFHRIETNRSDPNSWPVRSREFCGGYVGERFSYFRKSLSGFRQGNCKKGDYDSGGANDGGLVVMKEAVDSTKNGNDCIHESPRIGGAIYFLVVVGICLIALFIA